MIRTETDSTPETEFDHCLTVSLENVIKLTTVLTEQGSFTTKKKGKPSYLD